MRRQGITRVHSRAKTPSSTATSADTKDATAPLRNYYEIIFGRLKDWRWRANTIRPMPKSIPIFNRLRDTCHILALRAPQTNPLWVKDLVRQSTAQGRHVAVTAGAPDVSDTKLNLAPQLHRLNSLCSMQPATIWTCTPLRKLRDGYLEYSTALLKTSLRLGTATCRETTYG